MSLRYSKRLSQMPEALFYSGCMTAASKQRGWLHHHECSSSVTPKTKIVHVCTMDDPHKTTRGEWCKAGHEEVQARERDEVHRNFAQVAVELTWEPEAAYQMNPWKAEANMQFSRSNVITA